MFEQWLHDVAYESLAPAVALEIQARLLPMANYLADAQPGTDCQQSVQLDSQGKAEQMACHISCGYGERLTIPQIAAEVDLHPDYAATRFKKTFGSTIVNFITRCRIAHAQRLLLSTDDQIINIAVDSGFDSLPDSIALSSNLPAQHRANSVRLAAEFLSLGPKQQLFSVLIVTLSIASSRRHLKQVSP